MFPVAFCPVLLGRDCVRPPANMLSGHSGHANRIANPKNVGTTANAVVYKWKERKSTPLIPLRSSVQGINSRALTLAQLSILSACTPLVGSLGSWDPLSMEHVSMHHGMHRCSQVPRPPMAHARPSKHSTPDLDTQRSSACVSMDGGACSRDRARHMLQCFLLS